MSVYTSHPTPDRSSSVCSKGKVLMKGSKKAEGGAMKSGRGGGGGGSGKPKKNYAELKAWTVHETKMLRDACKRFFRWAKVAKEIGIPKTYCKIKAKPHATGVPQRAKRGR